MDILIVEDDREFRDLVCQWMTRHGHEIVEASRGQEALRSISLRRFDVAIIDLMLPDLSGLELIGQIREHAPETEIIMLTGSATVETAVEAMKRGAADYLTKPFPLAALEERCRKAAEHGRLRKEAEQWKTIARRQLASDQIIGESAGLRESLRLIERVAPTDKPVLILGETGVGKELAARAVQRCSSRAERPFVIVNCAALPDQLIESELFGHEKGSFTGATETKAGLFEVADGGTLFIDEIGELPLALQPKLLRVLEDGSFRRVGSTKERRVDLRLIAATHRDLEAEVRAQRFREDLWFRINLFPITLPPLRQRAGDVELLTRHFLPAGWQVEPAAAHALATYSWPGNVRQLRNVLDRATVLAEDRFITLDDLPPELSGGTEIISPTGLGSDATASDQTITTLERNHVVQILTACDGNKSQAARALGIHRRKLYRLLERLGLSDL